LPEFNLKAQYDWKCEGGCEFLFGLGGDLLTLKPRQATAFGYKTDTTLTSTAWMAYVKYKTTAATVKAEAVYGGRL
jgi:hypothetical protein